MTVSIPSLSSLHPRGYDIYLPNIGNCGGLAAKRNLLEDFQTGIPNCESRKAYAQLLLDEDIFDMTNLIANSAGTLVDRVNENFEPYTVETFG